MPRRRTRRIIALLIVAGALGGTAWYYLGRGGLTGQSRLERWCGEQVLAVCRDHLRPEIAFDAMRFSLPATVTFDNFRLVDKDTPVITIEEAAITLGGVPRTGEPIRIAEIALTRPTVRLIVDAEGNLAGLTDMVKPGGGRTTPDGGSTQLSDVLAIRKIVLDGATVSYEPAGGATMRLGPLTFKLDHDATTGDGDGALVESGWYAFSATCTVEPAVDLDAVARLNIDTGVLELSPLTLHTDLSAEQYTVFTPDIQALLDKHKITGVTDGRLTGTIPFNDTAATDIEFAVHLADAGFVIGEQAVPITSMDVVGSYRNRRLDVPVARAGILGGTASLSASLDNARAGDPFVLDLSAHDVRIKDLMKYGDKPSDNVGSVTASVHAEGRSDDLPESLTGSGTVSVDDARLAMVSAFSRILNLGFKGPPNDRGNATFTLYGNRVHLDYDVLGRAVAIKGSGDTYYDGRLDQIVNAGPVERLNAALGPLGEILGSVTSLFVKYQVTGTLKDPKIEVRPFGLGAGGGG